MTDDETKEWNRVCFEFNEIVVQNHHMDLHIEKLEDKLDGLVHANRHFMDRIEQLTSGAGGIMEMKQTIANLEEDVNHYKEDAHYANGVADLAMKHRDEAEAKVDDLEAEIVRLKAKCDMQANVLRRLTPDKFPDTLFISGVLGERDFNNMPQKLLVVPAYGVDFSYIYERTEKTTGPEW